MKKVLVCLVPLLLWSCGKDYNNVIDPEPAEFSTGFISDFQQFTYSPINSNIKLSILVAENSDAAAVTAAIYNPDGKLLEGTPASLLDNGSAGNGDAAAGDKIYSALIPVSNSYPNGKYTVDYYAAFSDGSRKKIASHNFSYNNGQDNRPPEISDLNAPDSVNVVGETAIPLNIRVSDPNGLGDIKSVYFITYRPNGTTSGDRVELFDKGGDGDQQSGDGIYSVIIKVTPQNTKGRYRFEFEAEDRSGVKSNIIIHYIEIL